MVHLWLVKKRVTTRFLITWPTVYIRHIWHASSVSLSPRMFLSAAWRMLLYQIQW